MTTLIDKMDEARKNALAGIKRLEEDTKLSQFTRQRFNEIGLSGKASKAEEMLDELYDIACGKEKKTDEETGKVEELKKAATDDRLKAIKLFSEMAGGGMNEKQTNIQNNNYGNIFLDMLSTDKNNDEE